MVEGTSLPEPSLEGQLSLEEALLQRRSVREFSPEPMSISEISQLLWAAQGITGSQGFRTAPSAGALYPLELYVVLEGGVFHYNPHAHNLTTVSAGDLRADLYRVSLRQDAILKAPMILVITAVFSRTEAKYGRTRSPRYIHLEAGHAAQNTLLQAVSLGLGAVPIGAFEDIRVQEVLGLPADHEPLYLIPIGHPK
ncbi:MAG: nitroreductase [Anaerolineae bacterium SM23_ 63]|nr:MAG: nitroreductase [Anaerolineae bacterium SM23_ 63]